MNSERQILERLRRRNTHRGGRLQLGIGDDCAIYRPAVNEDLVFTTDFLIENVHFRRETHRPSDIGYKALARGLSDLAAMGAVPRFCLLSLAVPADTASRFVDRIFDGVLELGKTAGCPLAGGDLSTAPIVICDIVGCGSVERGTALRRSSARVGDGIWVSGTLGGSALGLESQRGAAWRKHLRPEPRLRLGRWLRTRASAAMDLSDGLSLDLARLCRESGVAAELEEPPVFRGATLAQALHGGEDYELLFTAPRRARIPAAVDGLALTRIGTIVKGSPGAVRLNGKPLPALGYDHFATRFAMHFKKQ